jgi:hypothetical protein
MVGMIQTCKHCGAPLAATMDDRCPSCGARMNEISAPMQLPRPPASAAPGDPPPDSQLPARYAPAITPSPVSTASAPPLARPARQSRRRLWLILGLVGALLLTLCGGCGGVLYWAIASQLAPSQANEALLLQDSLLDSNGALPFLENHCGYVSEGYLVDGASCIANAGPFDDIDISVTVRQISGSVNGFYGIMLRQHDGQNAYIFDISTDGSWRFQKITANSFFPDTPNREIFVLPTRDQYLHAGRTNTLLVRAIGGHFTFYGNNFKLGEVDDSGGYSSGGIGLVATQGARAAFTKLLVTRPKE